MTRLLVIGLCIVSVSCIAAELTCPDGEIVNNCPTSCKTTCPKSEKEAKESCPKPDPCPEPACQCRYFERRADNGTCINTKQCPPFDCSARPNERFDPCPALCPTEDCSQAALKGICPSPIGIVLICKPACRCIKDHYRKDGICVPEAECGNGSTTTVRPEEGSTDDTWDFETQTLEIRPSEEISEANAPATSDSTDKDLNQTIKPKDNPISTQTADSEAESDNEMEDDKNDTKPQANSEAKATSCMSTSEAKSSSGEKENTCGPNEEYDCRMSCPPDTCDSNVIRCASDSTEVCKNGCYCKEGFLRANETAPCMPQCDCKNIASTDLCQKTKHIYLN